MINLTHSSTANLRFRRVDLQNYKNSLTEFAENKSNSSLIRVGLLARTVGWVI